MLVAEVGEMDSAQMRPILDPKPAATALCTRLSIEPTQAAIEQPETAYLPSRGQLNHLNIISEPIKLIPTSALLASGHPTAVSVR